MFKLASKILLFVTLAALATSAYSLTPDYVHKYKCELNLDKYSKQWKEIQKAEDKKAVESEVEKFLN